EVLFNYTGLLQHTNVTRREFLHPVVDTTFLPDEPANDGTMDNTTAVPESNYILPSDTRRYRRAMAYHSIGMQLRTFINGSITEPGKIANTRALQTRLLDPTNWLGVRDMQGAVQGFYEDMLLSMLSNPQFLAVAWAAAPEVVSGVSAGGENTMFPCTRSRNDNRGPGAGGAGAGDEADLGDLEELERGLVDGGAVTAAARGEVVDDGTLVGLGPGVPLEEDLATGGDDGGALGVGGAAVAGNVAGAEGGGGDEAVVKSGGGPADEGGVVGVVGVGQAESLVLGAVGDDALNVAVGHDGGGASNGGEESVSLEGRHFCR
ncbi:hypothetical protein BN1723_014141, partial [Verticillium longisporum]